MNNPHKKIWQRPLAILALFFVVSAYPFTALAASSTAANGSSTSTSAGSPSSAFLSGYICTPDNSGAGSGLNVPNCINNIYIFAVAFVGFMSVLIIVFAGYLYMTGGSENITKAKEYISGVIAALIILFSTYAILNTINPNLTNLNSVIVPQINCGTTGSAISATIQDNPGKCALDNLNIGIQNNNVVNGGNNGSGTGAGLTSQAESDAKALLNNSEVSYGGKIDCSGNGPQNSMQYAAQGQLSVYDGPKPTCDAGTVALNQTMLDELLNMADKNMPYTITSLTGGWHSSTSDPHYAGAAVDLVPKSGSEINYINNLYAGGAQKVAVECDKGGQHIYVQIPVNGTDSTGCQGTSGYHIHAQWIN